MDDDTSPKQNIQTSRSQKNINVMAKRGSVQSGNNTVYINTQMGMVPNVNVSGDTSPNDVESDSNLNIQTEDSNVSIAKQTSVLVNIHADDNGNLERKSSFDINSAKHSRASSENCGGHAKQHDDNTNFPTEPNISMKPSTRKSDMKDSSSATSPRDSLDCDTNVENSVIVSEKKGSEKLHFCVQQKNKYIQIGKCCIIVEINVNNELIDALKERGCLGVDVKSGETLVSLHWRDTSNEEYYISQLKLIIDENNNDLRTTLETEMLPYLVQDQCEKVREILKRLLERNESRLRQISSGCVQLTLQHFTLDSFSAIHSQSVREELENYFNATLISSKMREISVKCRIKVKMLTSVENPVLYSGSFNVRNPFDSSQAAYEELSSLGTSLKKTNDDIQMQITEIKQENARQMTDMQEQIKNFIKEVSVQLRETKSLSDCARDEMREEVTKLCKEVRGMTSETLKENQQESLAAMQMQQEELRIRMRRDIDETTEILAERLSQILLSRLPQSMSLSASIPQEVHSAQQRAPLHAGNHHPQDPVRLGSLDRHEMISSELRGAFTAPSVPQENVPSGPKVFMDCFEKTQYFLEKICSVGVAKHTDNLYAAQSGMGDEEALQRALAASTQQTSSEDQTLVVWLSEYLPNNVFDKLCKTIDQAFTDSEKMSESKQRETKAIDSVLVLDTSKSMEGDGIKTLKEIAHKFISSVEDQDKVEKLPLKENIGIVTFGSTCKLLQPLTNNHSSSHEIIDSLSAVGKSTLIEGIMLALCAIARKGAALQIGKYHRVPPRIIIISDGLVTDCSEIGGTDLVSSVNKQTASFLEELMKKLKECGINYPMFCVPVGQKCQTVLQKIGKIIQVEEAEKLNKFYHNQIIIGKALKYLHENKQSDEKEILRKIVTGLKQFDENEKEEIEKEIIERRNKLPHLGTRVKLIATEENKCDTGTVMQHLGQDLIMVILDNGEKQYHDWSFGQSHLILHTDSTQEEKILPIGTLVERGKDWNFNNQDGGPKEIGVVIRKNSEDEVNDKLVRVCWRSPEAQEKVNVYRYGVQGQFDVQKLTMDPEEDTLIKYKVKGSDSQWKNLPDRESCKIEKKIQMALNKHERNAIDIPAEKDNESAYRISLDNKQIEDLNSKEKRCIQRDTIPTYTLIHH